MSDMINRDKLLRFMSKKVKMLADENGWHDHYVTGFDDAITYVEDYPAADAVEVVRCRECVFRHCADLCPMCWRVSAMDEMRVIDITEDDGFCHKGAKMDGGAD